MYQDARDDAAARERRLGDLEAAGVTHRVITADNRDVFQVVTYLDPGEFPDQDGHGYEIAYYGWERHQHTGDVFCGSCARELVKALEPGDEAGVYVAYQINAEVGDRETIHCTDCMRVVYAGADLDWDPANAPEGQRL